MEIITSVKNKTVVDALNLKKDKNDYVFLEGEKQLVEAINNNSQIEKVFVIDTKYEEFANKYQKIKEIVAVSSNVIEKLSSTKTPQGVIAIVKIESLKLRKPNGNYLVLDNIQDPGNMGTIIRSAVGADFLDIYSINSVDFRNDKVVRSTMGNIFKVNIFQTNNQEFIENFKNWNLPLYSADFGGENIFEFKPENKFGVVIGNEGNGVSEEISNICTKKITIPMKNNLESLNAGVSSAIIMYVLSNNK